MKNLLSILFICLLFSINSNAQLLNKLKEKAGSAVNKATSSTAQNSKQAHTEDNASSSSTTTSSTISNNNNKMDYPFIVLSDAKFYFSDKPFTNSNAGAKTNFTSQDFIYGRVELGNKTIAQAFKLDAQPTKGFHYLKYGVLIKPKGEEGSVTSIVNNRGFATLINDGEEKNTWLNFDVLAEPARTTTVQSSFPEPEKISDFPIPGGMDYNTSENDIRNSFPKNGVYTIKIILWTPGYDDYGNRSFELEENTVAIGEFDYDFNAKDAGALTANAKRRYETLEKNEKMKTKLTKLPDWWSASFTPGDAFLKPATLTPMIKAYIGKWNLTYISHRVRQYNGTAGWTLFKDNIGLPVSRRANPEIHVLYKDADGACHIGVYSIDEDYAGGGTWGSPYMRGYWADEFIDCSAIK